jgi:D-alanyl-D-alanine carboxypeptidase (penicillin-binding protein 5/6)
MAASAPGREREIDDHREPPVMGALRSTTAGLTAACCLAGIAALGTPARAGASPRPSTSPAGTGAAQASRLTVGGPQLAGSGVIVNYPSSSAPRLPGIPATAYVVADAGTGQVLAAKDPHGLLLPASTLKVLTAITLIPLLNPNGTVVATKRAASATPNDVGLVPGQQYKISDLFRALLLVSANDAAIALAQATGSYGKGIALMNAEAQHLQAYDVVAKDPNGLDAPGQHVSAYDLALIARRALAMPAFMAYDSTLKATFPVRPHKPVTLYNQNSLLTEYPGGIGGKIGWTEAAGATYIGLARRNGVTLIVTILHCRPLTEVTYAERLLDWGFAVDGKVQPVGTLVSPLPAPSATRPPKARATQASRPGAAQATPAAGMPAAVLAAVGALIALAAAAAVILLLLRRRAAVR